MYTGNSTYVHANIDTITYLIDPGYCAATTIFSVRRSDEQQQLYASQEPSRVYHHVETCFSEYDEIILIRCTEYLNSFLNLKSV